MITTRRRTITPTLLYELEAPTSQKNYNTGIKLLEYPRSFTVLCEAYFKNYNWTNNQRIWGTGNFQLGLGRITSGLDYRSNVYSTTATRYCAPIMNTTSSGKKCTAGVARTNGYITRRFGTRYNANTREFKNWISSNSANTQSWYILDDDPASSTATIGLNVAVTDNTCTVNIMRIYDGLLTDDEIKDFVYES